MSGTEALLAELGCDPAYERAWLLSKAVLRLLHPEGSEILNGKELAQLEPNDKIRNQQMSWLVHAGLIYQVLNPGGRGIRAYRMTHLARKELS